MSRGNTVDTFTRTLKYIMRPAPVLSVVSRCFYAKYPSLNLQSKKSYSKPLFSFQAPDVKSSKWSNLNCTRHISVVQRRVREKTRNIVQQKRRGHFQILYVNEMPH